jgi:Superfamily II DNA and RNA helicases
MNTTTTPTEDTPQPEHFSELALDARILRAVSDMGYEKLTPIQAKAIPLLLDGRDIMGAAQTGTGKTAAFSLPILQQLLPLASTSVSPARHPVRALMLAPTRELADQVYTNLKAYAKHTPLRCACVFGGMDMAPQKAELRTGVDLLVATPGRLLDHLEAKTVNLGQVQFVVLDEADRMLDIGFLPDLQRILASCPSSAPPCCSRPRSPQRSSDWRRVICKTRCWSKWPAPTPPRPMWSSASIRWKRRQARHPGATAARQPAAAGDRVRQQPPRRRPTDPLAGARRHQGRSHARR